MAIILAIAIWLHEYAHAWASNALGDPTPKLQGRLTPNPLAHLDPLWFLLIFIIHFGRGKPVQINPHYYKHPQRDELLVALAWPASNVLIALVSLIVILVASIIFSYFPSLWVGKTLFMTFFIQSIYLNLWLALFNLIPLPPLDGRKIVKFFVRDAAYQLEYTLASNPFIMMVVFIVLSQFWLFNFISQWTRAIWWWMITTVHWLLSVL